MYNEKIEALISAALADGVLTEKEKQVLFKRAQAEGIDLDEFEMVLDARLVELQKAEEAKAKAEKEKSAPKSNKYGDVRKCPVCGAMVPALAGICPECGYEFSGVDANLSSQKLAEMLLKVKTVDEKKEIITTFPIPNTKADLFEFITSLQPRIRDIEDPLSPAYFKKYQESINKAKVSFNGDKVFLPYIEAFPIDEKTFTKKIQSYKSKQQFHKTVDKIKRALGNIIMYVVDYPILSCILAIIIIGIIWWASSGISKAIHNAHLNASMEKIELSIQTNNADDVMNAVKASVDFYHPLELLTQLIEGGYLDAAIYFYNHKTSHCSTYDMKYENLNNHAIYTKKACKLLYDALINSNRMEEAWNYHPLEYDDPNYAGNANSYYSYVSDVINYYCAKNDKASAKKFLKEHLVWFSSNVDNGKWGKEHSDFYSAKVNQRLIKYINNY